MKEESINEGVFSGRFKLSLSPSLSLSISLSLSLSLSPDPLSSPPSLLPLSFIFKLTHLIFGSCDSCLLAGSAIDVVSFVASFSLSPNVAAEFDSPASDPESIVNVFFSAGLVSFMDKRLHRFAK